MCGTTSHGQIQAPYWASPTACNPGQSLFVLMSRPDLAHQMVHYSLAQLATHDAHALHTSADASRG